MGARGSCRAIRVLLGRSLALPCGRRGRIITKTEHLTMGQANSDKEPTRGGAVWRLSSHTARHFLIAFPPAVAPSGSLPAESKQAAGQHCARHTKCDWRF